MATLGRSMRPLEPYQPQPRVSARITPRGSTWAGSIPENGARVFFANGQNLYRDAASLPFSLFFRSCMCSGTSSMQMLPNMCLFQYQGAKAADLEAVLPKRTSDPCRCNQDRA